MPIFWERQLGTYATNPEMGRLRRSPAAFTYSQHKGMKMNAEMIQKLIDFGAMQERSRAEFIAQLNRQYLPDIGMENQPVSVPVANMETRYSNIESASPRRGRKPNANGLATQIRALLADNTGGTAEDIAVATAEPTKKVVAALNSMKARGIVFKSGKCWSLTSSNGASAAA